MITKKSVAITIVTDRTISTIKKILAAPCTCENERNGNSLVSIGNQATG
jgi:hypothetical protein